MTLDKLSDYTNGTTCLSFQSVQRRRAVHVSKLPKARTVFLSSLVHKPSVVDREKTLLLKDRGDAAHTRDYVATQLSSSEDPLVLVIELAGISYTPSALQEFLLPLVQRIRGGEHGTVRIFISTTDPGVGNFIRYMAEANQLALYLTDSPFELQEGAPVGVLTSTERKTLDTINVVGGKVTAAELAELEGINPSAATNRLVNLDREGYLFRHERGRREGDLYIEPRSFPMEFDEPIAGTASETG